MVIEIKKIFLFVCFLAICLNTHAVRALKLMQFNIWQEGTQIKGGFEGIVDNILLLSPDVVTFSEVRNYNEVKFIPRLVERLKERGVIYYGNESISTGIISKYRIIEQQIVYPLTNDRGSILKACIEVCSRKIAVYSAHLDWLNCSSYLPRGYDGCTWKEIHSPVTSGDELLSDNRKSFRPAEIKALIADAKIEIAKGALVLIGGDFNEPSFKDWGSDTKDIRQHMGMTVDWDCTVMLEAMGYSDVFREIHPNAVKYPGFTFPANNPAAELKDLCWAPKSDERERIDYIFYYKCKDIFPKTIRIVAPCGDILNGSRVDKEEDSKSLYIRPIGIWPSDHKALVATFIIK